MNYEKSLVRGTVILASSTIVVKILSAAYKIPLTRILGAQTMGMYTATFNVFMPFFAFSVAGIVPCMARLSAEYSNKGEEALAYLKTVADKIFLRFSYFMLFITLIVAFSYAYIQDTMYIFYGVILLAPNLIFATKEAIYKGLAQGMLDMQIGAKAAVLESSAKIIIGIGSVLLAGVFFSQNLMMIRLFLTLFTVSIAGYICLKYMQKDFKEKIKGKTAITGDITFKRVVNLSLPIALSALVVSGVNFFDTVIGLSLIKKITVSEYQHYYSLFDLSGIEDIPLWLFGVYHGLTLTVVNLIPTLSAAIGQSGLPVITKTKLNNDTKSLNEQIVKLLKLTAVSVVPISMFVFVFSQDIIITLFGNTDAQSQIAAMFLKYLAPVSVLSAFSFPFNSILHAYEKAQTIFKILVLSSVVKAFFTYYLASIPSINIKGCIYSSVIFYVLLFVLSLMQVKKTGAKFSIILVLLLPLVASYISVSAVIIIYDMLLFSFPVLFKMIISGSLFLAFYAIIVLLSNFLVD